MMRRDLPSDPLHWLRESSEPSPPEAAEARLAARLAALSALPAPGTTAPAAEVPNAAPSLAAAASGGQVKMLAERFVRWSLVPFGLGAGVGAATMYGVRHGEQLHPPAVVQVTAPIPSASSTAAFESALEPTPEPRLDAAPVPAAPVGSAAPSTLPIERDLLDRARRQLASDEPARALTFLEQHARRFPRGQLSEEREAMWVNVLAQLGRGDDARAKGAQFEARFPHSLMGPSVRAAVQAAGNAE